MTITFTELQKKEVVLMHSGEKLGMIEDLEINEEQGKIIAIIVSNHAIKGAIFQKLEEVIIDWEQITTIGRDIILIDQSSEEANLEKNIKNQTEDVKNS